MPPPFRRRSTALASLAFGLAAVVALAPVGPWNPAGAPATAAEGSAVRAFGDAPPAPAIPIEPEVAAAASTPSHRGLVVATARGAVFGEGDAPYAGGLQDQALHAPVVAIAVSPSSRGYWLASADGGVFTFGDASFEGSLGAVALNQPIVGMASTASGRGYWLAARDGGIFAFGDARFVGSLGDVELRAPIVAVAATPTGAGYWLVAADGGVFAFGDATFHGSLGDLTLDDPVVGMAATGTGAGYWLVARDGGVFAFGDAPFQGSLGGQPADGLETAAIAAGGSSGYWIVQGQGGVRVSLAGDVHGEGRVRALLDRGQNPLSEVAVHFRSSDLTAVNLETPVARPGTPQNKEFVFLAPTSLLDAMAASGVDVVTLANNHALDHGRGALLETLDNVRRSGITPVGAGRNAAEAYRSAYFDVRGRKIAVLGLSRVVPPGWAATATTPGVASAYDERAALGAVRDAAAHADAVIVLVHWGIESEPCAGNDIVGVAQRLHDAGATVVAGAHPHVLQGIRTAGNGVTAFSLGNFVWYHDQPPSNATGVLDVRVGAGPATSEFFPARIGSDGRPRFLSGSEADAARRRIGTTCAG